MTSRSSFWCWSWLWKADQLPELETIDGCFRGGSATYVLMPNFSPRASGWFFFFFFFNIFFKVSNHSSWVFTRLHCTEVDARFWRKCCRKGGSKGLECAGEEGVFREQESHRHTAGLGGWGGEERWGKVRYWGPTGRSPSVPGSSDLTRSSLLQLQTRDSGVWGFVLFCFFNSLQSF